jgi:beta-galactosidase
VHNWSWEDADLRVPVAVTDVLGGGEFAASDRLTLGPWDVKVLLETAPGADGT